MLFLGWWWSQGGEEEDEKDPTKTSYTRLPTILSSVISLFGSEGMTVDQRKSVIVHEETAL